VSACRPRRCRCRWQVLEFLKFFHATNHQWSSQLVTINNDTWKKIKPEHQKAIATWARSSSRVLVSAFQADKDSSKKMIEGGMTLSRAEPMMADLRKRTASCWRFHEARAVVPGAIKAYLAELKRA